MDVFVRDVGGSISGLVQNAFTTVGEVLRGVVAEVLYVVPAPLAALIAALVLIGVGWRFAK
jgi:hypothetical protein